MATVQLIDGRWQQTGDITNLDENREEIRKLFSKRGIGSIGTANESEEDRLNRLANEIASGSRTFRDIGRSLDPYATPEWQQKVGYVPGTGAPPSGTPATPPPDPVEPIDQLRQDRLAAALAAIDAQFAAQEGGLRGELRGLENLFDLGLANSQLQEREAMRQEENLAARSGLGHSGIFARNVAEALQPIATQRADLIGRLSPDEGAEGTEIRDIMSALALLEQQRASARAQAELDSRADQLDLEQYLALINAGLPTG